MDGEEYDSAYCHACCNFSLASISRIEYRQDVYCAYPVQPINGNMEAEYSPCQFDTFFEDICLAAREGCLSCMALEIGVRAVFERKGWSPMTDTDVRDIELTIAFAKGNILRFNVHLASRPEGDDDPFGEWTPYSQLLSENTVTWKPFECEFYTVPGE